MQHLPLDSVVVPHTLHGRVERLPRLEVETDNSAFCLLVLHVAISSE